MPRPGNPKPAIDPDKTRRIGDFTKHAMERVDQVIAQVGQLLDPEETLAVAINVTASLAGRAALFARENDVVDNPQDLLRALGLHIAKLKLEDLP